MILYGMKDFIDEKGIMEQAERDSIRYEHELANEQLQYSLDLLPSYISKERIDREREILSGWTAEEIEDFYREWGR